jgi:hypothetical protein
VERSLGWAAGEAMNLLEAVREVGEDGVVRETKDCESLHFQIRLTVVVSLLRLEMDRPIDFDNQPM